ncbi:PREDICTED: LOC110760952 partial [Prunus dulcis]|uniref:PREDICTED: LOC110760952 partial n=1 Tax=Prunus dulcis TaxID=3755 RepID=A0A5E4GJV3_PRUDU|nr:PREDICTED: LOC110760952 partial [Prunus dulcis]
MSWTPLEARIMVAKKARESSTRAKDSSKTQTAGPKVDKCNFTKDVCVYDLLVTNFLSSPSACIKLVDHIHQLSELEKKNVDLTGKLSAEQICHETRVSEMNESMYVLKNEDVETFYSDMLFSQSEQINAVDIEVDEEQLLDVSCFALICMDSIDHNLGSLNVYDEGIVMQQIKANQFFVLEAGHGIVFG